MENRIVQIEGEKINVHLAKRIVWIEDGMDVGAAISLPVGRVIREAKGERQEGRGWKI